ncbi:hypothetical protein IW140_000120 [Coemansia sp. RSA 1813]|nr:hypothetical protein EV178_000076 [Coemansia sp. RSA 1646]KAJ1772284.1 hypothetical protein LPJ74_001549 [Coemansia sp. RSA 1843]KAJ2093225.1 hypothetical protein IW138_000518 [Coemansia sp. RSA 986]KAJ2217510.1 hypothetical protein EV179_000344 [Coemansia sp. RSA 487]KAJ2573478.1 hypothetical protein IW140_000120 [Coemansia sp. RSA 1813]
MSTDALFFDSTLAELNSLTASIRTFAADSKVPLDARYPPKSYDFQMPPIQSTQLASEDRQDYFTLNFKTLKAPVRKYTVHASSVRTVGQVKRHLSRISNIPVSTMRLVLGGKGLVDTKLIGDYNIQKDSVIQIISKPAGGAATPVGAEEAEQLALIDGEATEMSNPLLSALGRGGEGKGDPQGHDAVMKKSMAGLRAHHEYTSDASSDGESSTTMSHTTKEQLQKNNSAFRNSLRDLVHGQFGTSQATIVDRLLDTYFESL